MIRGVACGGTLRDGLLLAAERLRLTGRAIFPLPVGGYDFLARPAESLRERFGLRRLHRC